MPRGEASVLSLCPQCTALIWLSSNKETNRRCSGQSLIPGSAVSFSAFVRCFYFIIAHGSSEFSLKVWVIIFLKKKIKKPPTHCIEIHFCGCVTNFLASLMLYLVLCSLFLIKSMSKWSEFFFFFDKILPKLALNSQSPFFSFLDC